MENSLIENIENNAAKYDDSRDNLKERFIDIGSVFIEEINSK